MKFQVFLFGIAFCLRVNLVWAQKPKSGYGFKSDSTESNYENLDLNVIFSFGKSLLKTVINI